MKSVAESIVILRPMFQVGCLSACAGVTLARSAAGVWRNGPPDAVRISRRMCRDGSPTRHWKIALCSLSTGRMATLCFAASRVTSSPAMTRISLLATASVFSGADGRERRGQSRRAHDGDEHHVGFGQGREFDQAFRAAVTGDARPEVARASNSSSVVS